jgi:hypothetical protein
VRFPTGWGAPESIVLDDLISWTGHPDPGVKHFSGTATYVKQFDVPDDFLIDDSEFYLNLGNLATLAEIEINDRQIGLLWKPPYEINISDVIKSGTNRIEIHITNLWPNRLIGDEKINDADRFTFTTWTPFTADSDLIPSGLFGPVQIYAGIKKQISW